MKIKRAICLLMTALFVMAMTPAMAAACTHSAPAADSDCIVCKVAAMINALPAKDEITIDNAAKVIDDIHAIDRIKYDLSDEEYEEMLTLVEEAKDVSGGGLGVPKRYVEAVERINSLTNGGWLLAQKKFVAPDGTTVDVSKAEVEFEITGTTAENETFSQTLTLFDMGSMVSDFYAANMEGDGWTYKYLLPAGTYTIEEISDKGATVDGKPFITGSTTYEVNGTKISEGATIEVKAGESYNVVVYNRLPTYTLTVANTVENCSTADNDKEFEFNVKLPVAQNYSAIKNSTESVAISVSNTSETKLVLKNGESITITIVEAEDSTFEISASVEPDFEITSVKDGNGADITLHGGKVSGIIDPNAESEKVSFTHKRKATAPTNPTPGGGAPGTTTPSGYSGPSLWYIGGNTFGTSTTKAPTKVEIDGAAVPFTMDGSKIIVSCINADADWVTARWGSTTNTVNFTPDAAAYCTQVSIPKTGDMPLWAAIAAFLGF